MAAKMISRDIVHLRKVFRSISMTKKKKDTGNTGSRQKKVLAERWASLQRLSSIYDAVSDIIFDLAVEAEGKYRIVSINQAFCNVTGLSREDVIGKMVDEIIPGQSLTNALAKYKQAADNNRIIRWEVTSDYTAGQMTGEVTIVPFYNEKGLCTNLMGTVHDISEHKRVEDEIAGVRSLLESTMESTTDGIMVADGKGGMVWANVKFREMWGIPEEIVASKDDNAAINYVIDQLKEPEAFIKKVMDLYSEPEKISFDEFELKDGRVFNRYSQPRRIGDAVSGRVWSFRDISERKQSEKTISMLAHAIRSISECVSITDMTDKIVFVNSAFLKTYQYEEHELIGNSIRMVRSQKNSQTYVNEILPATLSGGWHGELLNRRKDGSEFPVFVSSSVIHDENNKPLALIGITTDITERKKIESQMIQSERLAALGEMLAGMAHEINQPLNTLSILFDNILFEAKEKHSVSQEYLVSKSDKIFNNILRIKNLIDHVREFSRSQEGYILTPFNINDCILNALSMVSEQFKIAGISLITRLEEDLPMIKGNTYKFEQVILNLMINAKDALLEKKSLIKQAFPMFIKIMTSRDDQLICIEVEDNGAGIKDEHMDKILQPFYTTKETGKGTGLGLSISYGLIQEINGKIDIQSKVLEGTLISVTIPLTPDK
jgi:PAS domain S-box-containing protein